MLEAQHDLTVTDALMAAGSIRAQAGHDIAIAAPVGTRSNDATLDFRAGNAFTLGANATLTTGNLIYVQANRMDFAGNVAGANGQLPQLSLNTADPALPIRVGSGDGSDALVLDARTLNRLGASLYELDIGTDKHTGGILIDGALSIDIANEGDLMLLLALQEGSPNTGAITIENAGALTVPDYVAGVSGEVRTGSGDIALIAHGPLTIRGRVATTDGNVRLAADTLLTVAPDAQVTSAGGRVSTAAATEQIAPGTIRDVDSAPTAAACLASPSAPGCAAVLEAAARTCAATPGVGDCSRVLAQYAALCASRPADAACAAIHGGDDGQAVQLAQAQQAAVQLINTGTQGVVAAPGQQGGGGQETGERTAGPAQAQDSGAKHDKPATKMYCD